MIRFRIRRASVLTTRERDAKSYSDCTILSKAAAIPDEKGNVRIRTDENFWHHDVYVIIENTKW